MKTTILLGALLMVGTLAFANEKNIASVSVTNATQDGIVKLAYVSSESQSVKVSIYNQENELIFSERITEESFVRPYNLSDAGEGTYTVVVEDKNGKNASEVVYKKTALASVVHLQNVYPEEGKVFLRINNLDNDDFTVKVYNNNKLVHKQTIEDQTQWGQVYDVSKLSEGAYFEVTSTKGLEKIISL
ncbi:hypothetical protein QWY31_08270 [Cytophagales bacterium LB-30]|uniref:T9SS type A sorting domain-containing protein n=1 Tax=Shiella aurantiaca TaxID=3058365 RepID=A0ABT8F4V1_9BACT|nr:hypothetical protein [Shiella aurantiaca]MDN4165492.1 hypothetical protein [Shiella aurantiaca]